MIRPIFVEDNKEEDEEKEDKDCNQKKKVKKDKKKENAFTNTINFIAPFLNAITLSECFMLISTFFCCHLFLVLFDFYIFLFWFLYCICKYLLNACYYY